MHRRIDAGKIRRLPADEPRSAIYAAMLFDRYPDELRVGFGSRLMAPE